MYTTDEVLDDPQARHLQLFVETEHPAMGTFRTVRSPVSFDGERALEVTAPPLLGEHNAEIGAMLRRPEPAEGAGFGTRCTRFEPRDTQNPGDKP